MVKPVKFILKTTIGEELDNAIYGRCYQHTRDPRTGEPYVRTRPDGPWFPVQDWKTDGYDCSAEVLRRIAAHFIEIGKQLDSGE